MSRVQRQAQDRNTTPKEMEATEITPERAALRDALANAIRASQPLRNQVAEQEEAVTKLRGQLATTTSKLEEVEALYRATEQRLSAVLAQQGVLASLFLGGDGRSPKNPNGLTLEAAFQQNFDGLKTTVGAM